MSTAALPGSFGLDQYRNQRDSAIPGSAGRVPKPVRRRGSLEQGFALEALGHAVEFLVDSRLFCQTDADAKSDQEAIQILMRLSREVFSECPAVIPVRTRVEHWLQKRSWPGYKR